ncbi:MAG TPA: SpoIIE family protein phosphatase, partial [Vicinamibacterales bacterium]|nr:SpoIIE family protein phosphatase [Vicinamibacterales bacterium]
GWFRLANFNLTSPGDPQYLAGAEVTLSLARSLGAPSLGQWFADEQGAVISNTLWMRLGGDPNIVGKPLTLDDRQFTITGVMPREFQFPVFGTTTGRLPFEIWIALDPTGRGQRPDQGVYFANARRKPGVSVQQAQADVARVAADIARADPVSHPLYTAAVMDLRRQTLTDLHSTLLLLFGAAGLLLLIACANVATLLLARSVARARETAIRVALGAGRAHLALRYLSEGAVVSLIGAAAGVGLSVVLVRLIVVAGSEYVPVADELRIDRTVLAFAIAMAFVASALASLAPLWQALRTPPNAVLTEGVRASAASPVRKVSQALVVAEIALAFTLLTVSILLVLHLRTLGRVPTGFDPNNLLTFQLSAPGRVVGSGSLVPFQKRLIEALEGIPGVTSAAVVNQLPLDGCCMGGTVHVEGRPPGDEARRVSFLFVTPGFLPAMGVPLRAGRFLTEADTSEDLLFAVVNQAAVDRYWPDRNPIGMTGRLNRPDGNRFQVVGVIGDIRNDGLNKVPEAELYLLSALIPVNPMSLLVRSSLPSDRILPDVRRAVQNVDRTLAIHDERLMTDIVQDSLQLERVSSLVMTFFGLAALFMATLGIYGVVSYGVRQRTVELGTRMALGAVSRDLMRMVVGSGLRMAALGIAVGALALIGSVAVLTRALAIRDVTWVPFVLSIGVVAFISVAASSVPAWRASLLSPMVAIRDESSSTWRSMRRRFRRAVEDVRGSVTIGVSAPTPPTLLTEFVAAARAADSFDEALRSALATLGERLGVESGVLLERVDEGFRGRIAIGAFAAREWNVPADGFLAGRLAAYPLPLPFERDEFGTLTEWAAANRPERLAEICELAERDVRVAVPLRTRTEVMGILLLGPAREDTRFGAIERQVLRNCADQFALMMENARLTDRMVGQEALRRDLALAVEVQKRLLPSSPPSANIAEFAAVSVPARSIGGDYYDFIEVGEQRIGIALADVSGKGVAAALIMSVVQASLRIIASDGDISLPRLAERMNEFLYRTTPGNKYATFFYAQVDGDRRQLRYVNAGHNPPYLVRARGNTANSEQPVPVEELTIGGAVVGMLPGMSYEEATIDLCPGDVLLAYTDGVTEAHNPDNDEFGEDRLKVLLGEVAHLSADEIRVRISSELKAWIKDAEQYDDLTFVVMKVN